MATGGSGDLLTGILTGLLAQGLDVEGAVKTGVFLHGLAGDLAADEVGQMPLIARDVMARFHSAVARLRPAQGARGRERATT
jgi:NAD(P)H-hydrate epimerase